MRAPCAGRFLMREICACSLQQSMQHKGPQVIMDEGCGLLFKNKRDRKARACKPVWCLSTV